MDLGIPPHSQAKFLLILLLQRNLSKYTSPINSLDETKAGFYQMSDGIELFKSVGKTAALWNLVVFAIEMTDKAHSVTKNSECSLFCPQGNIWILISENRDSDLQDSQWVPKDDRKSRSVTLFYNNWENLHFHI